jgi:hypothetical protein
MSEDTVGDAARVVNGNVPITGRYTLERWGAEIGKSAETIRRWVHLYDIRFKQLGDEMVVDAEDLWAAIPYQTPSKSNGKSKKKG